MNNKIYSLYSICEKYDVFFVFNRWKLRYILWIQLDQKCDSNLIKICLTLTHQKYIFYWEIKNNKFIIHAIINERLFHWQCMLPILQVKKAIKVIVKNKNNVKFGGVAPYYIYICSLQEHETVTILLSPAMSHTVNLANTLAVICVYSCCFCLLLLFLFTAVVSVYICCFCLEVSFLFGAVVSVYSCCFCFELLFLFWAVVSVAAVVSV